MNYKSILSFCLLFLIHLDIYSTHIRAGEVVARRISTTSLTYEFTVIGYTDTGSEVEFGGGEFSFGDGNIISVLDEGSISSQKILLDNQVALNLYKIVHTFQAPGRYVVSYFEQNRNDEIVNMDNSVDTPFFIETEILIDPFFGLNNTPVLLIPPIDNGVVGIRYIHNPGAFDPDGDSLSYELVIPMQSGEFEVTNYRYPNFEEFYQDFGQGNEAGLGEPTFTLDSIVGDLIWDAPGLGGEYNFAFRVVEWRKVDGEWYKLGHVTRDMQVIIEESENDRPTLEILDPICVEAGKLVRDTVTGEDPNFDDIKLEAFGGPFEFQSSPASYLMNPAQYQNTPADLYFEWQTECSHVRERPYDIQFKVTDKARYGPNLVEFSNWQIQVVAPAPTGLSVVSKPGRSTQLSWDLYSCDNSDKIQIWRRVGSYDFNPEDCEVGMPDGSGYKLVSEVDADEILFDDTNDGAGLAPGSKYCYRILAEFPLPEGGTSYVSQEVCTLIEANAPVMTNVSVNRTNSADGIINVKWFPPLTLDTVSFPLPFYYKISRYNGYGTSEKLFESDFLSDTTYLDNYINTSDNIFSYKIEVFDSSKNSIDFSYYASSVRLELSARESSIDLSWSADVPWSNSSSNYPYHYIYRNNVSGNPVNDFILIDSINVIEEGFNFKDDGSFEDIPLDENKIYCYYVVTSGSYENNNLPKDVEFDDLLLNNSQRICAQTNDLTPPCPPLNFKVSDDFNCENYFNNLSCDVREYENRIEWQIDDSECSEDTRFFNVYFSDNNKNFEKIGYSTNSFFLHKNLSSLKGYYFITALDRSGNESIPSDTLVRNNCPQYILPNVFTPNEDGKNDTFSPFFSDGSITDFDYSKCPRFVRAVDISIVDRTGNEVFNYNSDGDNINGIYINWDGKNKFGADLAEGTYYYNAKVIFDVLDGYESEKEIKGWVQLIR
tara:strand:- start:443 stop:3265 length:2823 start_codon:yes stop_codon:yes gene_type:complete